jgi:hypothetical protein
MNYTVKAEKLEVTFQLDAGFVEALLGAVRATKNPHSHRIYTPYPEGNDEPDDTRDEPDDPDQEVDRTSTVYGTWYTFVLKWLVNFDREGEQPDRATATRSLAHSRKAGKIITLVRKLGGITHAVNDVVETSFFTNESARLDGMSGFDRKKLSRQIAENMTQVCSILFSDLSDLLEYHNPLEEEED